MKRYVDAAAMRAPTMTRARNGFRLRGGGSTRTRRRRTRRSPLPEDDTPLGRLLAGGVSIASEAPLARTDRLERRDVTSSPVAAPRDAPRGHRARPGA